MLLNKFLYHFRIPIIVRRYTQANSITTIELRQWLPVLAFGFTLVWYIAAPTDVTVMLLVALGGVLAFAFLWARAMARGVTAKRVLHYAAVQVGDELEEQVTLDNASALPVLWAEFVDRSDLPGYSVTSVRAADGHSTLHWRARAICARRGLFRLGPWELHLGDPFGIFRVRQVYFQRQELLVYPPLAALPSHLLPHNSVTGDRRPLRQPLHAETINAMSARPYLPGDPLRHVHWRTTARRDAPYAKVFEPEATSTIWLMPDFDAHVHLSTDEDSTEETMVLIAASLAAQLLRARLSVGLLAGMGESRASLNDALTDAPTVVVPPQAGQPHLWQILRALAPLHPVQGWPLAQSLIQARPLVSARDLLVVITPSLSPDWPRALGQLIRNRRSGAEAILLDPASFGGQSGDVITFSLFLAELGIRAKVVRRGDVRPSGASYGALRRWEFITLGTGRVVARQTPRAATSLNAQSSARMTQESGA